MMFMLSHRKILLMFAAGWLFLNSTFLMKLCEMTSGVHPAGVWPAPSVVPPPQASGVSGRRTTPSVLRAPASWRVPSAWWTTAKAPPSCSVVSVTGLQLFCKTPTSRALLFTWATKLHPFCPQMVPCILPESPLRGRCGKSCGKWLQLHDVSNLQDHERFSHSPTLTEAWLLFLVVVVGVLMWLFLCCSGYDQGQRRHWSPSYDADFHKGKRNG